MYEIVLNKNKSVGKIVFIVEGDKKEHTLLGHLFTNILDYSVVDLVESGRITQAELDRANVKCREVYRPVLIAKEGQVLCRKSFRF